jgi:transposase
LKKEFEVDMGEMSILMDSAGTHNPSTHKRVSPFHKWSQEKLGMKGVMFTPPYSPWTSAAELAFSYLKRTVRKTAPETVPELICALRKASDKITGEMIQGWYRKCGFDTGKLKRKRTTDPNAGTADRCTLPQNAKFQRREHVACFDAEGKLRKEKKVGHSTWSKFDDKEEDLENLSVSKRKGVLPTTRVKRVGACPEPEEGKKRWTGVGPEPPGLEHADYGHLWEDEADNALIAGIVGERKNNRGVTEFKVRWHGFDATHDEWLSEDKFTTGKNSLLRTWEEVNKRKASATQLRDNKKAAAKPPAAYKPNRKAKKGDVVAIYAGAKGKSVFYMGRVLDVQRDTLRVHWWFSKKLDGVWAPQYKRPKDPKKKGTAGPYVGNIAKASVMDVIPALTKEKKGKIPPLQLKQLVLLVKGV